MKRPAGPQAAASPAAGAGGRPAPATRNSAASSALHTGRRLQREDPERRRNHEPPPDETATPSPSGARAGRRPPRRPTTPTQTQNAHDERVAASTSLRRSRPRLDRPDPDQTRRGARPSPRVKRRPPRGEDAAEAALLRFCLGMSSQPEGAGGGPPRPGTGPGHGKGARRRRIIQTRRDRRPPSATVAGRCRFTVAIYRGRPFPTRSLPAPSRPWPRPARPYKRRRSVEDGRPRRSRGPRGRSWRRSASRRRRVHECSGG